MKKLLTLYALSAALLFPGLATAESDVNTAAGPSSSTARLDFEIVIPRVLFLQVGTGTVLTDGATVDKITFTVPAANVADGSNVAGTGGDAGAGAVNVRLFGNAGNITLAAASTGAISNGTETIPWTELAVTAAAGAGGSGFTAAAIAHPSIDGAGSVIAATNKVIRQHGTWTFAYDNTQAYAAGTYGGTNTNNSRISYTASMP